MTKKWLIKQLIAIEEEAADRVWYDRTDASEVYLADTKLTDEHKKTIVSAIEKVKTKYNIKDDECDEWYHAYWSGILALSRYLLEAKLNDYDVEALRTGADGLLDT